MSVTVYGTNNYRSCLTVKCGSTWVQVSLPHKKTTGDGSERLGITRCVLSMTSIGDRFSAVGQNVLDNLSDGMDTAFSALVHSETVRNFADTKMLVVPAAADPPFRK